VTRRALTRGSIFMDVVVTLLIAAAALLITLGGIALTARVSRLAATRTLTLIEARNEDARSQKQAFARDLLPE
jgi:hypothetical protein